MAAASALHELTRLQWNPTFSYTQPSHHASSLFFSKPQRKSNFFRLQIVCKYKQSPCSVTTAQPDSDPAQIWKNSFDQVAIQTKETLNCALVRSGGRLGGRAFSSSTKSFLALRSLLSWIPLRSLLSWIPITPFCVLVLAVVSSPLSWTPIRSLLSWIPITLRGLVLAVVWSLFSEIIPITVVCVLVLAFVLELLHLIFKLDLTDCEETSVLKLQVGLLGSGRTILEDFNRLAESADTSTEKGRSYVLTEATLALLRHLGCCISCYSSVDVKRSTEDGERQFNQLSFEERGKFNEETLVNVNSIKRQSSKIRTAISSEYIVVTILVAAKDVHKLQPVNGTVDLKEALKKLGSIPRNKIMAVEVQWTPQNEDTLSEKELLEDYPLLKPL